MIQQKSYVTVDSKETLKELVEHIRESEYIAFDTETDSLNPRKGQIIGFSVSGEVGRGYYMPTMVWKEEALREVEIEGKKAHDLAKYAISQLQGKKLICHNASFDLRYVKNFYGINLLPFLHADTSLIVHTVKEEGAFGFGSPFGLKPIAIMVQKEIGLDVEKEANEEQVALKDSIKANGGSTSKENYEIYKADLEILSRYAAADTDLTLRIYNHFLQVLISEGLEKFFFEEEVMPVYREVTIPMEEHGIRLNIPLIQKTRDSIAKDLEEQATLVVQELLKEPKVRGWIIDQAVEAYPPKSKGTFAQRLLEQNNLELPRSEKTGKFTINKAAIVALPNSAIKDFLITGDIEYLTKDQIVKTSLSLWREENNGQFFNIQSKDQMGKIAFDVMGEKPISSTTKGKAQFDEDMIQSIKDKYTWAKHLRLYNKLTKIKTAYVDRFLDSAEDGRFYPYFKQNGTVSGRYGSDMQQLPKPLEPGQDDDLIMGYTNEVRAFFIADEGTKILDTDYASLEPRVFATVAGDQGLKDIFNNDLDFYSHIAIKTEKLEGVSAHTKAPNFLKKVDPVKRQTAKAYSLGVPYGMSGYALAMSLGVDRKEGERLIEGYLDGFPELRTWRENSRKFVKENGYIKNKVGRVRHLPQAREIYNALGDKLIEDWKFRKNLEREYGVEKVTSLYRDYKNALNNVLNFQIQSYSASIVNRAALQINRRFQRENIAGQVICQIHDQLICQVKDEDVEKACPIVQDCMENTTRLEGVELVAIPEVANNFRDGH
jgi:DNA polymerase I-like protein with 3'-5' exonuclease and polymerase domains